MKQLRQFVICLLFVTAFVSCSKPEEASGAGGGSKPTPEKPSQEITPDAGMTLYGLVSEVSDGTPVEGAVVSDGYSCVTTDSRGVYQMKRHRDAKYVFISTPSDCECLPQKDFGNMPMFYQACKSLTGTASSVYRADFQLKKRKGSSTRFRLVAIGDPQPDYDSDVERFRNETVADINREISQFSGSEMVSIALGDIIGIDDNHSGKRLTKMKKVLGEVGTPVYHVIGNHDKDKLSPDGLTFSNIMGPLHYSFNMGLVHFVILDNLRFSNNTDYTLGFTKEQYDWLVQDLSFVPKNHKVVLCYHAPMYDSYAKYAYATEIFNLILPYKDPILIAGHTHNYKYSKNKLGLREYILSTACGYFWRGNHATDGTPNGYYIFSFDGTEVKDMYFKGTDWDKSHQMRIYRASDSYSIAGGGTYSFADDSFGKGEIAINVFSGGPDWKVTVYEDGVKTGTATCLDSQYDRWMCALYISHAYKTTRLDDITKTKHIYRYTLKNPSASQIKVEAQDPWGNVYTETSVVGKNDFSLAMPPYLKSLKNGDDRPYNYNWINDITK